MSERNNSLTLLSLLVEENAATHSEAARALSWLIKSPREVKGGQPDDMREESVRPSSNSSPPRFAAGTGTSIALAVELDKWLSDRASSPTNWFVMKGNALDHHLQSLEEFLQITSKQVIPAQPGTYEIEGLWRIRPGVIVSLYYPANFDPDDQFATVASKVSYRNSVQYFELPGGALALALDKLLRQIITGAKPQ